MEHKLNVIHPAILKFRYEQFMINCAKAVDIFSKTDNVDILLQMFATKSLCNFDNVLQVE